LCVKSKLPLKKTDELRAREEKRREWRPQARETLKQLGCFLQDEREMTEVSSQRHKKGASSSLIAVDSSGSTSSWGGGASAGPPPSSGKGSYKYPDGGYYEGEFQASMRHGNGMMIFAGTVHPPSLSPSVKFG